MRILTSPSFATSYNSKRFQSKLAAGDSSKTSAAPADFIEICLPKRNMITFLPAGSVSQTQIRREFCQLPRNPSDYFSNPTLRALMFLRKSLTAQQNALTTKTPLRTSGSLKQTSNIFLTLKRKLSVLLPPPLSSSTKRATCVSSVTFARFPKHVRPLLRGPLVRFKRTSNKTSQAKRPWLTFKLPLRKPLPALTSIGVSSFTFGLRPPPKFILAYHPYITRSRRSLREVINIPFALSDGDKLASFAIKSTQTSLVLCTGDANFHSSLSLLITYASAYNQTPSQYAPHLSSLQYLAASCGVPLSSEFGATTFSDSTNWPRLKRVIIANATGGCPLAAFNAASNHRCRALMYSLNYNIIISTKRIGCFGFNLGHEAERIVTGFLPQCPTDAFGMSNIMIVGGHFSLSLLPSNRLICV
ncbi:MAG: hypothetical protein ACTS4W_00790 [Candidatus Hodgkinia cicadicola]